MNWLISLLLHRGNDLSTYFLPNAYFFKRSILEHHQIPLWNPIQFAGFPYIADPQNYLFYLPNYLFVALPVEVTFLILLLSHLILAGVGTFLLAKKIFNLSSLFALFQDSENHGRKTVDEAISITARSRATYAEQKPWASAYGALFSSLAFVFTPKIFSHLEAGHYTMIIAFSWLPLFTLIGMSLVQKPELKKAVFLALISWVMYLNYINIIYFALIFFAAYSIFHLISEREKINLRPYAICYVLFAASFAGLIAPVFLPQIEIAPQTTRSLIAYEDVAQPVWSFRLFARNLLFPFNLDYSQMSTERVLFPGLIISGLALVGFLKGHRLKLRWLFFGWFVFSVLFALGDRVPFFIFFYKFFPLMNWMRVTTRLWIISTLLIALLAGLGANYLWAKTKQHYLLAFLLFLGLVEVLAVDYKIFTRPISEDQLPESFYTIIKNDPEPNFRVYCATGCFSLQRLGELGVYTAQGNNPVQLKETVDFLKQAGGYTYPQYIPILPPYPVFSESPQPSAELFAQINTKYIASPYLLTDQNLKLIHQEKGFLLYQNDISRHREEAFPSLPQSLRIGLVIFSLTWAGLIYAYRHPQLLLRPRRARR